MFKQASKSQSKLRLAIIGPAGSGKTYTALRIAAGIGGRTAVIDTERGSASLYADKFHFDVCELPDRSPGGYCVAIEAAAKKDYPILIIDSLSHAWQELCEQVEKMAHAKFGGNTWAAWSEGTPIQRRFVDAMLNYPGHVISTMRVKTEWEIQADEKTGKKRPIRIGLTPEQRKGMEYEFTMLMQLSPEHVAHVLKDRTGKYQDAIIDCPDENMGVDLKMWLEEGSEPEAKPEPKAERPAIPMSAIGELNAYVLFKRVPEERVQKMLKHYGVSELGDMTAEQAQEALTILKGKN